MSHFCVYVFHDENTTVDELLAPYDENIEFAPYVLYTKEQAIAKVRSEIEDFRNGIYKEYLEDPVKYKENWGHLKTHIEYLENEFPKKLNWTDEECYEDIAKWRREEGMVAEDGSILSTYNPKAKWDWYQVGGRWRGGIPGDKVKMSEIDIDTIDTPYAFVTTDGEWVERGKMGWFGISSNEMNEDEWDVKFREYLKTLDKDIILTLVDCHI